MNFKNIGTCSLVVAALTLLNSCGGSDKGDASPSIKEFGISESCKELKLSESQAWGELERFGPNNNYSINWQGDSNLLIDFWTERGLKNIEFEVYKSPLSVRTLKNFGSGTRETKDHYMCFESYQQASGCHLLLNKIVEHINLAREQDAKKVKELGITSISTLMDDKKLESLQCTSDFLNVQMEALRVYIEANMPAHKKSKSTPRKKLPFFM